MKKLLLLSHFTDGTGEPLEYARQWMEELFNASPEHHKTVLYIPYAQTNWELDVARGKQVLEKFGLDVVSPLDHSDPKALLDSVDGIFVSGGNTFRLLDTLQKNGLLAAMAEKTEAGMPYMGFSAGSNIACPTISTTNDAPIVWPVSPKAMGVVPFQINPHYVDGKFYYKNEEGVFVPHNAETREQRIAEFHSTQETPVIGLKDGSALRIIGDKVELLGNKTARLFTRKSEPVDISDGKALSTLVQAQNPAQRSINA